MVYRKERNISKKCVKPQLRFAGFEEDWEWRKIREICKYCSSNLSVLDIDVDGKYQLYDANGVIGKTNKLLQKEEYITIIKDGSGVGRVRKNLAYSSFIGTMGAIVPNDSEINYLFAEFQRKDFSKHINGATIPHIYFSNYGEDILCIPNVKEQQKIGVYFCNLDKLITLYQNKYDKLTNIKKSMLEKMFPKNGSNVPEIRFKGFSDTWERRKLDEWGTFYYGRSCPKWSVTENATIPCIRYGELYTKFGTKVDTIYSYTNMSPENLRFSKGTEVLIPRVGEDPMDYNHCTWLSIPDVAIGEMISVFNTKNNPLFTATMFNATLQNEFAMRVEGGSVTNLYFEKLKNIEVSFPTLKEQKKIGEYFETLDKLINLYQCKLEKLKNIKKACMEKMFV